MSTSVTEHVVVSQQERRGVPPHTHLANRLPPQPDHHPASSPTAIVFPSSRPHTFRPLAGHPSYRRIRSIASSSLVSLIRVTGWGLYRCPARLPLLCDNCDSGEKAISGDERLDGDVHLDDRVE